MAIKAYKPVNNSRRGMTVTDYSGLSKVAPEKSLLEPVKKTAGRNSYGRITLDTLAAEIDASTALLTSRETSRA